MRASWVGRVRSGLAEKGHVGGWGRGLTRVVCLCEWRKEGAGVGRFEEG